MDLVDLREELRSKLLQGKFKKTKKFSHQINLVSEELRLQDGKGKFRIYYRSDNPDSEEIKKKLKIRQRKINEAFMGLDKVPIALKVEPSVNIDETNKTLAISASVQRKPLKIVFNEGTDTTTTAIIGSSFSAGKTTIMMNAILPLFYGKGRPGKDGLVKEKLVYSPASFNRGDNPIQKIQYINTLFALNTHISAYQGFKDLIRVTGFEVPQQQVIKDMHQINVKTKNKYRFALFIDDILNVKHSKMLENCFMTYRNAEISSCVCMQHLKFLSPAVRGNVQNLIFCKLLSEEAIQAVLDVYLKSYFTQLGIPKADHVQFYRDMTDKFHSIHLHQGTESITFCKPVAFKKA